MSLSLHRDSRGGVLVYETIDVSSELPVIDMPYARERGKNPRPLARFRFTRITFEPSERGTRMLFRVHGQPDGPTRLVQPLLRLALKRQFKHHCTTLKGVLEKPETDTQRLDPDRSS